MSTYSSSSEFNNKQLNPGSGCSYSNLSNYNYAQDLPSMYAPTPPIVGTMAVPMIPQFSAPGYSTLQHVQYGQKATQGCGGKYFNVQAAYPDNCMTFAARKCA